LGAGERETEAEVEHKDEDGVEIEHEAEDENEVEHEGEQGRELGSSSEEGWRTQMDVQVFCRDCFLNLWLVNQ
jgi:hypothetical protein